MAGLSWASDGFKQKGTGLHNRVLGKDDLCRGFCLGRIFLVKIVIFLAGLGWFLLRLT